MPGRRKKKDEEVIDAVSLGPVVVNLNRENALETINKLTSMIRTERGERIGTLRGEYAIHEEVTGSISTSSIGLDIALGVGGFPKGRVVELFGQEATAKTTLAMHCVAVAQKMGLICAFIDAEHALDPNYSAALGVDLETLLFVQPDSGEDAMNILEDLIETNLVGVVVIDSVAALVPKSELEGDIGDVQPGAQARLMSQMLRHITGKVSKTGVLVIFINQMREKIGVTYGSPKTTSGGNALKFYASVRVECQRVGSLKQNDEAYGNRIRFLVVKNKVSPPFRSAEVDVIYGKGISRYGELIDFAVEKNLVQKSGAWYSYGDQRIGQGRENSIEFLRNHPEMANDIEKKTVALFSSKLNPPAFNLLEALKAASDSIETVKK